MTDRYADAGLPYLPIDRIDEFPACKDGRQVLMLDDAYGATVARLYFGSWTSDEGNTVVPTHFLPASLSPIGEHVAVECAAWCTSADEYAVSGHSAHSHRKWVGDGRKIAATVVARIPLRRPPHGEAL